MAGVFFDLIFDIPADQSFTYKIDDKELASAGKRAMVPFGRRESLGYIIAQRENPPEGIKEETVKKIRRVVDEEILFDSKTIELAKWMAGFYMCSAGQALSAMIPSGRRMTIPDIPDDNEEYSHPSLSISDEQANALNAIISSGKAVDKAVGSADCKASAAMFYLFGVTGSGKTEVFIRAAQHFLDEGKSVIYLVPEISLTHQTALMIGNRFGSQAATLHSGMTPSARLSEWLRIKKGEAPIVVGPRSAVFAPVPNLGLIIIDEEHDGSYKSGNTPRYHARQIAHHRCSQESACLVMGSATPSAETWKIMSDTQQSAKRTGSPPDNGIIRLDLSKRLSGGEMPVIKPVSLAKSEGCLTQELKKEIIETAKMGRQTILFLNRRGFAHFYQCPDCGWEQTCKRCSVSLTLHKSRGRCVCHYCGYSETPPKACPKCGCLEAGYRGFGTEMIEEEVMRTFPDLKIKRIDADTAGKRGGLEDTLALFKSGMIDILLGTQMVAKGLNFPGVRLVGVVFADTGLHLPDFRAAERTFSLIVQVAGRAGRYFPDSKVIVQTLRMEDPVITRSCALDVTGFFNAELKQRQALGFPPFSRLIRFTIRAKDETRAKEAVSRLYKLAVPLLPKNADMLGPAECPIGIINGNHRKQLIFRGPALGAIHSAAKELLTLYEKGKDTKTYLEIDVDPVSML